MTVQLLEVFGLLFSELAGSEGNGKGEMISRINKNALLKFKNNSQLGT